MTRTITIDPVTRIEGHARVEIEIDDAEAGDRVVLQGDGLPRLRNVPDAECRSR